MRHSLPTPPNTPAFHQTPPPAISTRQTVANANLDCRATPPTSFTAKQTPPLTHQTDPITSLTSPLPTGAPDFTNTLFSLPHIRAHHVGHLKSLDDSLTALRKITAALRASISDGERELLILKSAPLRNTAVEQRLAAAIKNFVVIQRKAEKTMGEFEETKKGVEECLGVVGVFEEIQTCVGRGEEERGRALFWEALASGVGLV